MGREKSDQPVAAQQHLKGADDNLAWAESLKASGKSDYMTIGWAITALFYSSVHEVRAYLVAAKKAIVTAHSDMKDLRLKYPELNRTHRDYEMLKQESQSARYYLNQAFTWEDFDFFKKKVIQIRGVWRVLTRRALGDDLSPKSAGSDK